MVFRSLKLSSVFSLLVYIVFCSIFIECNKYKARSEHRETCADGFCPVHDDIDEPCMDEDDHGPTEIGAKDEDGEGLYRWDPVKVGHVRELELEPNQMFQVITRAISPPIFEIPGFLSPKECDWIINKTKEHGLFSSHVHMDPDSIAHEESIKKFIGHANSPAGKFVNWDDNEDGVITKDEVKSFAAESKFIYMTDKEINEMIDKLKLTEFDDGQVTPDEFKTLKTAAMEQYFVDRKKTHPRHRDRFSEQTWLPQGGRSANQVLKDLRRRVVKLTRLPGKIVAGGEHLQVVHYDVHGHYHAHYDSQSGIQFPEFKCCHQNLRKLPDCRLCRYITILYYLNQPEEGGETAFPGADVVDFNETDFRERREGDGYNLSKFCHRASLVVPPKKGSAIMWYNHYRDKSGWLGDLDWATLHGGCDIIKGEKWIANNWLTAPEFGQQHISSDYRNPDDEDDDDDE